MTERDAFQATERRVERALNRWRCDLRDQVLTAYAQRTAGREKVDTLAYALLRRDIDRIYLEAYVRWPGDVNAPLARLIRGQTRRTWRERFVDQWRDVRRRLPADLRRAIEAEAA